MHTVCLFLSGLCPCAVPHGNLAGNVEYNGKCYLWYKGTTNLYDYNATQAACTNPTAATCADMSGRCITNGVGRAATFATWSDYFAVTSAFAMGSSAPIVVGVLCSNTTAAINQDPNSVCPPSPINTGSANWPPASSIKSDSIQNCSSTNPYVCVGVTGPSQWSRWGAFTAGITHNAYMCEAGKLRIP